MTKEWIWFCNHESPEMAILVAQNLNKLAEDGNTVMNCNFTEHKAGPVNRLFEDPAFDEMGAIWVRKVEHCRLCGQTQVNHRYLAGWDYPCGGKR